MDPWTIASAIGTICSAVISLVALYVALYVNYDASRPNVVAYLEHNGDRGCMDFIVSNFGKGVARDIVIENFDFSMVSEERLPYVTQSFIATGIPVLAPGTSRKTTILAGSNMQEYSDRVSIITVKHKEPRFPIGVKEYSEEFTIDYSSFSKSLYSHSDLHEIAVAIKKIASRT